MNHKLQMLHCFSCLLAAMSIFPSVLSCTASQVCEKQSKESAATAAAQTETGTPETQNERLLIKDHLPDTMDFGERTFTVSLPNAEHQNDLMGGGKEQTGDVVEDAVLRRNRRVEERLNIHLSYLPTEELSGENILQIYGKMLMAGDSTYDLMLGHQYGMTKLLMKGGLADAENLEGLDLDQPWWWNDYMDELTLDRDRHFFLAGDYILDILCWARAIFYNKDLYQKLFSTSDADELYHLVFNGTWTIDKLAELSKAAYQDINNDGKTDASDQLGFICWGTYGSTDPFIYSTDIAYSERDEDNSIILTMISEDAVAMAEKMVNFFWQPGTFTGCDSDEMQSEMFSGGNVLFLGNAALRTAQTLREMKSEFGFLPYPKFDEEQENYKTAAHDYCLIGAVNGSSEQLDIAGSILEALAAESYRHVTPAWYETSLKIKYTRDNTSARMIDLIHDSLSTNFIYAYSYSLANIGLVYRDIVTQKSKNYVSFVERLEPNAQKKLGKMKEKFEDIS